MGKETAKRLFEKDKIEEPLSSAFDGFHPIAHVGRGWRRHASRNE